MWKSLSTCSCCKGEPQTNSPDADNVQVELSPQTENRQNSSKQEDSEEILESGNGEATASKGQERYGIISFSYVASFLSLKCKFLWIKDMK